MKLKLLLIFVFSTMFCNAQSLANLDIKYGINKFKLESEYSLNKSNLSFVLGDDVKYYEYVKDDIKKVLDYKVNKIVLGYYKNKLYYIGITFDNSYHHSDIVHNKLKALFGTETQYDSNFKTGPLEYNWTYQWKSSKAILSYEEKKNGEICIWVTSKILQKIIDSSEF